MKTLKQIQSLHSGLQTLTAQKIVAGFKINDLCQKLEGYKIELGNTLETKEMKQQHEENKPGNRASMWRYNQWSDVNNQFNDASQWKEVIISHSKGYYKFIIPIIAGFYETIIAELGLMQVNDQMEYDMVIELSNEMKEAMKIAAKFTSKDVFRPELQCVCIDISAGKMNIVGTTAYILFKSETYQVNTPDMKILVKDITQIGNEIGIKNGKYYSNGKELKVETDNKYPDYNCVIPEYTHYTSIGAKDLLKGIKLVEPAANKTTNQVNMCVNGCIKLSAKEVDYGYNAETKINYSYSDVEYLTAFNAKYMHTILSSLAKKTPYNEVKIYNDGGRNTGMLIKDDRHTALLMPITIED